MIFNTIFDHIYVLNLKESVDRRTHIESELKRVNIEKYELFEATKHDSDEVKQLVNSGIVKQFPNCFRCNKKRCACENNYLTPYQLGNWCSFINIFKDIIKNDYKFVFICEDDIVFSHQYKRIIDKLLSPNAFRSYKINMNKPLLIRMGTAYNPNNHNSNATPIFLKNYSLCNPAFAINKEMAIVYLYYLKVIDYHSDIYFHRKIPANIKGVQYFTMYPYPIYELSFVKEKQKFESLVRPKNAIRRMEYKEYLFLSSNFLMNIFINNILKYLNMDISFNSIGYNGNVNSYLLLEENDKLRYYFENKIIFKDSYNDNIKLIYCDIINNKIDIYKLYINKIKELYNVDINFNQVNNYNKNLIIKNIITYYTYYLKLIENCNFKNNIIIDINNLNDEHIISEIKFIKSNLLISFIQNYKDFKKLLFEKNDISDNIVSDVSNVLSVSDVLSISDDIVLQ